MVGVDKCGTSAMAKFLMQHSKVNFIGETYFFNRDYSKGKLTSSLTLEIFKYGFKKILDAIFGKNIQKHIGPYPFILEVSL